jgi:glycosyltransferase involved in cell wall biosynthesis
MRIALVLAGPYAAPRGSQVLVRQLATGLRERGHVVRRVTYGEGWPTPPADLRLSRVAFDVGLVARLWRTVRRAAIDVIHAHNYEAAIAGLLVGRATGRPVVYHGHSALAEELPLYFRRRAFRRLAARAGRFLDAEVPRRADFCIAVTEQLGALLAGRGVPAGEIACLEPVRPPGELGPAPVPAADEGLVCYAGNLDGYQNLPFLLRAFARVRAAVPGVRLVLLTHDDGRIVDPPAGVEVVRARTYDEVRDRLRASTVAVCPRSERSGFPMKLFNYMAAGKAIVASAGSAKGIEHGVTGLVVADDDEAAFAAAITTLLGDRAARERLGRAARHAVESPAAWDAMLDRLEQIYARVTARAASGLVPLAVTE